MYNMFMVPRLEFDNSIFYIKTFWWTLQWRRNERDGVSNHQAHDCFLNRLSRRRSKKTSKLRVTGFCGGNSPVTGEFPAQRASNAENVSIWWRHYNKMFQTYNTIWHRPAYADPRYVNREYSNYTENSQTSWQRSSTKLMAQGSKVVWHGVGSGSRCIYTKSGDQRDPNSTSNLREFEVNFAFTKQDWITFGFNHIETRFRSKMTWPKRNLL